MTSSLSHNLQGNKFSGLVGLLTATSAGDDHFEVVADIEGEQETMPAHDDSDNGDSPSENLIGQDSYLQNGRTQWPKQPEV